jgi:hypothetical protein
MGSASSLIFVTSRALSIQTRGMSWMHRDYEAHGACLKCFGIVLCSRGVLGEKCDDN